MSNKKNAIIAQSGGPTAAINSSLAGVYKASLNNENIDNIYGALNGIEGVINSKIIDLKEKIKTDEDLKILMQTPSSFLGSCRYKLPNFEKEPKIFDDIFETFKKYNIGYFFYIGGNDSMDTVMKLSEHAEKIGSDIKIIGIPKTIDNDLKLTDHTPGYGTAAKYVATTIKEIARDNGVYDMPSVVIIEIMGRNAGWLTASAALAKSDNTQTPDLIYLPEVPFSIEKFIEDVKNISKTKKQIIVAVSEGVKTEDGKYLTESSDKKDTDGFAHSQLGGVGKRLEYAVKSNLGYKVRSIELSLLQRCSSHIASLTDITEAFELGVTAVNIATDGYTGKMVALKRTNNETYNIEYCMYDVNDVANYEKEFPKDWINEEGNYVTERYISYARPLILGEVDTIFKDGVPVHLAI